MMAGGYGGGETWNRQESPQAGYGGSPVRRLKALAEARAAAEAESGGSSDQAVRSVIRACGVSVCDLKSSDVSFAESSVSQHLAPIGSGLDGAERLETLSLSFCPSLPEVSGFAALGSLKDLKGCSLDFSESKIQDVSGLAAGLGGMERLETLSLSFEKCAALTEMAGFEALAGLKMLRECQLNFSYSTLRDVRSLGSGLGALTQLERLSLNFGGCSCLEAMAGFEVLSNLRSLKSCDIRFSHSNIQDLSALGPGLGGMEQLQSLTLSFRGCPTLAGLAGLEALSSLRALETCKLTFSYAKIQDVSALGSGLGGMERLEALSLDFEDCLVLAQLAGFEALCSLKTLKNCELNFAHSSVQDLAALGSGLGGMEQLEHLTLNCCACSALVGVAGLEALSSLKALQSCKLDFSETKIRDLSDLASGLSGMEQLESISLSVEECGALALSLDPKTSAPVSSEILEALSSLPALKTRELRFPRVRPAHRVSTFEGEVSSKLLSVEGDEATSP
mmetsp:Transcript_61165/g.179372  ORF Transcript_61165/g.179372 Transcript_61165/m.179372 type:complete len:507 (+) Transcript_61165:100-1620(+)